MRAYARLRGKCPLCKGTFDLEHRDEGDDVRVDLNRGDCAILPNPAGWYMPPHTFPTYGQMTVSRVDERWRETTICGLSFALIQAGR